MPIESPQLDDLRYRVVFEQLRRQIPLYTPEWTDHNESDPGITLIQLFSHLAEQVGYRLNRLPDKAYLEFLKLIGIRLRPAEAATTWLAFYLAKPELAEGFAIPEGSRVKAKSKASPPPVFETTRAIEAVPAQPAALVTTWSGDLRDVAAGTPAVTGTDTAETYLPERFALAWDGRQPKLKDWPGEPVPLFPRPSDARHRRLWIGLAFKRDPAAGFLGQRVTLTVQRDDDEQPEADAVADCSLGDFDSTEPTGATVRFWYYRVARPGEATGRFETLGVLSDTTYGLTRSGQVRFDVPLDLGPIPDGEWKEVRAPHAQTTTELCAAASGTPVTIPPPIKHPLIGAIKNPVTGAPPLVPVMGWIGVEFVEPPVRMSLRAVTFNAAPAIAATTVRNELIGRGDGHSDQRAQLLNRNLIASSLEIAVEDVVDGQLHRWERRDDLDTAGPDDRAYVLDPEAGLVYFGDGVRGAVPALASRIVALRYRHGGGAAAELAAGTVSIPQNLPSQVQDVTNFVAARGGKDAETLDEAKKRAPRELKTQGRAVTPDDFELLARQTPGERIIRAIVVPLRRPYQVEGIEAPGLDVERVAPGVVSVIAVPDGDGAYLAPTETQLRAVCRHLDKHRLVTTELYVVAPQYVRLHDFEIVVVPRPGYGRSQLRETIAEQLEGWFHVKHGGPDGTGFGFGGTIHHAELVAQVFRAEGVERVEQLDAWYDGNAPAPAGAPPPLTWRDERVQARRLTACPETALDDQLLTLFPDETVFVDTTTLNVIVR